LNQVILLEKHNDLLEEIHKERIDSNKVVEVARNDFEEKSAKSSLTESIYFRYR
jgi:hypothetical protein